MLCPPVVRYRGTIAIALLFLGACRYGSERRIATNHSAGSSSLTAVTSPATTPERFRAHIAVLAHDAFQGRDTGERGCDLAAGYIAGQFAALGIAPGGPDGSYFQPFLAEGDLEVLPTTFLTVADSGAELRAGRDFQPLGTSANAAFEGDVVFAGYGIVHEEYGHDDYAGLEVRDKIVLMFRGAPEHLNIDGEEPEEARPEHKVGTAVKRGARAVLFVNTAPEEGSPDRLARPRRRRSTESVPLLHLKREVADRMLAAAGQPGLSELEKALQAPRVNRLVALTGVTARGEVAIGRKQLPTQNVLAMLPGQGPDAAEYLVLGAHYDHVGVTRGRVYNGADDNASGVSGLIELAAALAREPYRNRSILLIAFSGEEINLLGAEHFVKHPTVPLPQIKAMVNMDMIGRLARPGESNPLQVFGVGTGEGIDAVVDRRAAALNVAVTKERSAQVPTDSAPFYKAGVPALWFFTGLHSDYHRPGDDTEKIDADGGARIVHLIRDVILDLANQTVAPRFARVDERVDVHAQSRRGRPRLSLGIIPDFDDESADPGMAVGEVRKSSPAAKAGLRSGDRMTAVDGRMIDDAGDLMTMLADKKPGDTVQVTVRRGDQTLTCSVELAPR